MNRLRWIRSSTLLSIIRGISLILLILVCNSVQAQFTYVNDQSIPVTDREGNLSSMPWTGGINSAQFNTIDLNNDGREDLILFDRMANKVMTFLNTDQKYVYAPEYESYFPNEVTNWILLKDFNCDGRKDIFTGDLLGMKVYQNVSQNGEGLKWEQFLFYVPGGDIKSTVLLTKGFTQKINLQLRFDDLPTLVDVDQDGDLDIYNVRYTGDGTVEFHRNFSKERHGTCDSLDFERVTSAWGNFTQCKCEDFAFNGEDCSTSGGRIKHAGGKALLALDLDNDNDHELIYSEAECSNLFLLMNDGDNENPIINSASLFPAQPVSINIFPASFYEDVDFDGVKDLISTPNIFRKDFLEQDLKASTWLYKNIGSNEIPDFTFSKNTFLQDQMIDAGDNAVPAFCDEDGDGDLDMFVGFNSDASTYGSLYFYKNIGTSTDPHFQFITEDFSGIKSLNYYNIKPQFADINSDGRIDLTFSGTALSSGKTAIYYFLNTKSSGLQFNLQKPETINLNLSSQENFHFTDINHDGKIDILIGRFNGSLEYWQNIGTASVPGFYLENGKYLNLGPSVQRQSMACFAADLNSDLKEDLILSDQAGKISIINNFHETSDISNEHNEILFNPLLDEYQSTFLGRAWPVAVKLFDSKRPAIVAGTIRGGLAIFRNEEKEVQFDELVLNIYPNPAQRNAVIYVEANLPLVLQVYNLQGQEITVPFSLTEKINTLKFPFTARGLYIFKFSSNSKSVYRRVVFD